MKKSALITVFLTTLLVASFSVKGQTVQRMDPPNWWIDHPLDTVEILLQGEGLLKWAAQVEKPVGKVLQTTHYGDRYSLVKKFGVNSSPSLVRVPTSPDFQQRE